MFITLLCFLYKVKKNVSWKKDGISCITISYWFRITEIISQPDRLWYTAQTFPLFVSVESHETAVKLWTGTTQFWQSYHMKKLWITLAMLIILENMSVIAGPMKGMVLFQRCDVSRSYSPCMRANYHPTDRHASKIWYTVC